jgi:histidine ammonia-lyase
MEPVHHISADFLPLDKIEKIVSNNSKIALSEESKRLISNCRNYLNQKLEQTSSLFYGINTGFGALCNIRISDNEIEKLQTRLLVSHACGMGDEVPQHIVKLMLLLKVQSLAYGYSGAHLETIQRLIDFYNNDIIPVVFQQGSLGASGDLAPLAHLSLPLIGMGSVYYNGEKIKSSHVLEKFNWQPIKLHSKEGLALLNGTQFSAAYMTWCILESHRLLQLANLTAAISIDAFDCSLAPFDERLHKIRPHTGQLQTAANILKTLQESEIANSKKENVQDPYSFRCVPQVHGASTDAIKYAEQVLLTEINAVTDNPTIFSDDDSILSGGNFHAQPLALSLDFLAIAVAELGSISERRTYQLISGSRGLPPFLSPEAGLNSGLMIPQYTAASIVSQNKQLCTPASVDSIVSSNGQEDHVSMAANAATKAYRVMKNVESLIAIEFMTAAQALEFRRPLKSSAVIENIIKQYRSVIKPLEDDRFLSPDMHKTVSFLKSLLV